MTFFIITFKIVCKVKCLNQNEPNFVLEYRDEIETEFENTLAY